MYESFSEMQHWKQINVRTRGW